jgi:hypothetical protein
VKNLPLRDSKRPESIPAAEPHRAVDGRGAASARPPTDAMTEIKQVLSRFERVSLAQAGGAALLDRLDRKYPLPLEAVPDVLRRVEGYAALEVEGRLLGRYRTTYFDTPTLRLYHAHHSGELPRHKVRLRSYLDSGSRYFEVKRKTNTGRTEKVRIPVPEGEVDLAAALARASEAGLDAGVAAEALEETLTVDFTRVTLVANGLAERVTVDVGLAFSRAGAICRLPGVALIEVKQEKPAPSSCRTLLRPLEFHGRGLSKYCLGIALLEPSVKRNRFKPVLRRLESIGGSPLVFRP